MHNLFPRPRSLFTTRCAALWAAWWLAALLPGVWGWGVGNITPQTAFVSLCAAPAKSGDHPPSCVCRMCKSMAGTGAKCCCKSDAHSSNTPFERAALSARCDDGDPTPNAAPLAGGTWHAPVYFASSPALAFPRFACQNGFAFSSGSRLRGRNPAPLSPPPLLPSTSPA